MVKSLKITGRLFVSGFYFVTGIIMLIILVLSGGTPIHIGLIGILSIAVSYGLSKMKRWALYLLTIVFFSGLTFGITTIYSSTRLLDPNITTLSFQTVIILYLVLLVITVLHAILNREKFE